jgi:hypothetical protein
MLLDARCIREVAGAEAKFSGAGFFVGVHGGKSEANS